MVKPPWTISFWFQLRQWPQAAAESRLIASYEDIRVLLSIKDQRIIVHDEGHNYFGPKITGLENAPWILLGLSRDVSSVALYLNGESALEVINDSIIHKLDEFHATVGGRSHIEVIEQDLSGWVEKRNSMFKMKSQTSEDKVLLSPATQEDQLRDRVQALQTMLAAFHEGKTCFFDDILSNLRSLVFYKDKSQYDPLLLRLAAFKKMPLPVYIVPEQDEAAQHATGTEPPLIAGSGSASLEPQIPCVRMVDFQEYLERPALHYIS